MKTSVIIPVHGNLPRLKLVIAGFVAQVATSEFEVIVSVDGDNPDVVRYLDSLRTEFSLSVIEGPHRGRAAARNRGLRCAGGDVLVFCDADVIPAPGFVPAHLAAHSSAGRAVHGAIYELSAVRFFADPVTGELYPELESRNRLTALREWTITADDVTRRFTGSIATRGRISRFEAGVRYLLGDEDDRTGSWLGFTGGNVSIARDIVMAAGGFNEAFGTAWGCEDLELGYRLYRQGVRFSLCEGATGYHLSHYRREWREEHQRAFALLCALHPEPEVIAMGEFLHGQLDIRECRRRIPDMKGDVGNGQAVGNRQAEEAGGVCT